MGMRRSALRVHVVVPDAHLAARVDHGCVDQLGRLCGPSIRVGPVDDPRSRSLVIQATSSAGPCGPAHRRRRALSPREPMHGGRALVVVVADKCHAGPPGKVGFVATLSDTVAEVFSLPDPNVAVKFTNERVNPSSPGSGRLALAPG
jgi:hypothetical protein